MKDYHVEVRGWYQASLLVKANDEKEAKQKVKDALIDKGKIQADWLKGSVRLYVTLVDWKKDIAFLTPKE